MGNEASAGSIPLIKPLRTVFVVGLVGLATMVIELTATRALAPCFGASILTRTNVNGVVLLALSSGAWIGGILAQRGGSLFGRRNVPRLATALTPPAASLLRPLSEWILPPPAAMNPAIAAGHVVRGSLIVTTLAFGPAIFLLGMVGPWLIHLALQGSSRPTALVGRIFACSTLGSLLGTYLPAHLLLETVGVRWTFLISGLVLLSAALILSSRRGKPVLACLAALLGAGVLCLIGDPSRRPPLGEVQPGLRETSVALDFDSAYQRVRVSDWETKGDGGQVQVERRLILDEGQLEFHSSFVEGSPLTGHYYDVFAALPALLRQNESPIDVAILGGGAGTLSRLLRGTYGARIGQLFNVEIDPTVMDLRERFGVESHPADHWIAADARVFLAGAARGLGLIVLDAYSHQIEIPAHLATKEFFALARSRLATNGILAINVSSADLESPLVSAIRTTLGELFSQVAVSSWPGSWNVIVIAGDQAPLLDWTRDIPEVLRPAAQRLRSGWMPAAALSSPGRILTDDLAPLSKLAREIR